MGRRCLIEPYKTPGADGIFPAQKGGNILTLLIDILTTKYSSNDQKTQEWNTIKAIVTPVTEIAMGHNRLKDHLRRN